LIRPGITHVTFGPNDLEFSLELERHANQPFRTVEACMQHVADELKGSGIPISMGTTTTPDERQKYRDLGVTIFMEAPPPNLTGMTSTQRAASDMRRS
jgi:2-keto-3-deoxy-L-rhamnonate aldolase RhmA